LHASKIFRALTLRKVMSMENVACKGGVREVDSYKHEEMKEFLVPMHIWEDNVKTDCKA
jgi:hypothetical protein